MRKRLGILVAWMATLNACGGSDTASAPIVASGPVEAAIGGTVNGVPTGVTVLLSNTGAETLAVTGSGAFIFNKKVAIGASYTVTLVTQPSGFNCMVAGGNGTVAQGMANISEIAVTCQSAALALSNFNVGVTVSGLAANQSITFANGMSTLTVVENGLYLFAENYAKQAVYAGRAGGYEVTVKNNPIGQSCKLTGGSGALAISDRTNFVNVEVSCK